MSINMTVKELIELLQAMPQELPVVIIDCANDDDEVPCPLIDSVEILEPHEDDEDSGSAVGLVINVDAMDY